MMQQRLSQVLAWSLKHGSHKANAEGEMCVMEAVAYVAGERWSDQPACACPIIGAFVRSWGDSMRNDEERDRWLKPLIPQLVGSRATAVKWRRRSYLAIDWLVRVYAPTWFDLVPLLSSHAALLRECEPIKNLAGAQVAGPRVSTVWFAASEVPGDSAWIASGAAVGDNLARAAAHIATIAVKTAGGTAARAAADHMPVGASAAGSTVAEAAALAAAWAAAAKAAEGTVTSYDARIAATSALQPTTERLQASALNLVHRMLEVTA